MELSGKRVVITGVSSGIGERTAQLALCAGAEVIGVDQQACRLPLSRFVKADLGDVEAVHALAAQLPSGVDALVNNAGVSGQSGAARVLAVNFYGLRCLTEALASRLREGGSVVNVASIAGYGWSSNTAKACSLLAVSGMPDTGVLAREHRVDDASSYPLSKEMLRIWTMQAAHRWKHRGLRVNCVSPGPVQTTLLSQCWASLGTDRVSADIGRAGTPSDIAPVILFLCGDESRWINGANLAADGGLEAAINAEVFDF